MGGVSAQDKAEMTVFVDTSAWFAAINTKDRYHQRAAELIQAERPLTTSSFVLIETWLLLQSKISFVVAEGFSERIRRGVASLEHTTAGDLQHAWRLVSTFQDQSFSLVDRTSFAMMERLHISKAIAFDDDFVIYRYGANRDRASEVLR
jgi:predicted nucleic acid-binding protein